MLTKFIGKTITFRSSFVCIEKIEKTIIIEAIYFHFYIYFISNGKYNGYTNSLENVAHIREQCCVASQMLTSTTASLYQFIYVIQIHLFLNWVSTQTT